MNIYFEGLLSVHSTIIQVFLHSYFCYSLQCFVAFAILDVFARYSSLFFSFLSGYIKVYKVK